MRKQSVLTSFKRTSALFQAAVLASAAIVPALVLSRPASAADLANRYIDMSATQASEGSGRDGGDAAGQNVTYTVGFDLTSDHTNLEGVVIQFCGGSPIIGDACSAVTGFDASSITFDNSTGDHDITGWTAAGDADTIILSDATGIDTAPADNITFDINGITNPSSLGSFYARILTYDDSTIATAYVAGTPGANVDQGGIALAVANELTITARVQEVLQFCVGTTDAASADDCTDISGTDIDLGVVDTDVSVSATDAGLAMIRTNALNGAAVYYKAEQDNGSGKLKQVGATCSGVLQTDPCFNSAIGSGTASAPVSNTIVDGTEEFGMTVTGVDTSNGGATTNLARDAAYDGVGTANGSCTAANAGVDESCWAWADAGSFDTIASSGSVLDDEMLEIAFAATAAATTPTGLYTVTANFVATSTF